LATIAGLFAFKYFQNEQILLDSNQREIAVVTSESKVEIPEDALSLVLQHVLTTTEHGNCSSADVLQTPHDFKIEEVDLNDDQKNEYLVYPWEICGVTLRTASGNGVIVALMEVDDQWYVVGQFDGTVYQVEDELTNGFRDIVTLSSISYDTKLFSYYKWNIDLEEKLSSYKLEKEEVLTANEDGVWELDETISN